MSAEVKVTVANMGEVRRKLRKLGQAAGVAALKSGLEKASEPILGAARSRAPDDVIREGLQIVNLDAKGVAGAHAEVGLPGGRHPWFYGLFIEKGTGPRMQESTGRYTGSMPARPFLRPAYEANKGRAQDEFARELRRILEAAAGG